MRVSQFGWLEINYQNELLTLVKSLSSADGVVSFWNAESKRAKSNGGLGKNAFRKVARGPPRK